MDPISLIVTAVVAGAAAASKDVASQAVKDSYVALKSLIQRKFGQQTDLVDAVTKVEGRPDSEPRQAILKEELQIAKADQDVEIVAAAKHLRGLLEQRGLVGGTSYVATNSGDGAIAQGEGSQAAGQGSVVIGGDASGSTNTTGDGNYIDQSSRIFDQRNQKVRNQTNVNGGVNVKMTRRQK